MGINIDKVSAIKLVSLAVAVTFMDGSTGEFTGEFSRATQSELDGYLDEGLTNSELLDRVLKKVSGIGRADPEAPGKLVELPADEQMAFVRSSPECVEAAALRFFSAMRQERPAEKTSKRRR